MKKWYILIIATLLTAGTVQAHCGSCGADAKEAEKKASCEMKAAAETTACEMKAAAEKVTCSTEKKAECAADKAKSECAKKGSKWNPLNWFK